MNEYLEMIAEKKMKWLEDRGFTMKDVMVDEDEQEFVHIEIEGEGGIVETSRKEFLPDFNEE